ncbi:hypothetical protein JTE90_006745 [Oedothorax gibbosus]|uniref:CCHC-type domain-containing protein n=1 Tax=Oedothorax gibbosus TaxID=931172 RepID=A0AAV6UIY3_9ARAC|nr:hypothetical protein JTE90_006745 [Oedothorax gibbosus]
MLGEKELSLEKCCEIARAGEISKTQVKTIQGNKVISELKPKPKIRPVIPCSASQHASSSLAKQWSKSRYFCKKCHTTHEKAKCPAYGKVCRNCDGTGHFAVGCVNPPKYKNRAKTVSEVHNDQKLSDLNSDNFFMLVV